MFVGVREISCANCLALWRTAKHDDMHAPMIMSACLRFNVTVNICVIVPFTRAGGADHAPQRIRALR